MTDDAAACEARFYADVILPPFVPWRKNSTADLPLPGLASTRLSAASAYRVMSEIQARPD